MDKNTYDLLVKMLREANREAWSEFCGAVLNKSVVKASKYYDVYYITMFLDSHLRALLKDEAQ